MIYPKALTQTIQGTYQRLIGPDITDRQIIQDQIDQREGKSDLNTYAGTFHIPFKE